MATVAPRPCSRHEPLNRILPWSVGWTAPVKAGAVPFRGVRSPGRECHRQAAIRDAIRPRWQLPAGDRLEAGQAPVDGNGPLARGVPEAGRRGSGPDAKAAATVGTPTGHGPAPGRAPSGPPEHPAAAPEHSNAEFGRRTWTARTGPRGFPHSPSHTPEPARKQAENDLPACPQGDRGAQAAASRPAATARKTARSTQSGGSDPPGRPPARRFKTPLPHGTPDFGRFVRGHRDDQRARPPQDLGSPAGRADPSPWHMGGHTACRRKRNPGGAGASGRTMAPQFAAAEEERMAQLAGLASSHDPVHAPTLLPAAGQAGAQKNSPA